jgi:hypothetical protein
MFYNSRVVEGREENVGKGAWGACLCRLKSIYWRHLHCDIKVYIRHTTEVTRTHHIGTESVNRVPSPNQNTFENSLRSKYVEYVATATSDNPGKVPIIYFSVYDMTRYSKIN